MCRWLLPFVIVWPLASTDMSDFHPHNNFLYVQLAYLYKAPREYISQGQVAKQMKKLNIKALNPSDIGLGGAGGRHGGAWMSCATALNVVPPGHRVACASAFFFLMRLRLLLVCMVLARLMLLLMVHHLQLQMLQLRTMLLTSLPHNLLRLPLFHLVTLLLHLMTLLLHHMAVLMHCYLSLLRSPRWHKVTIFMVLLCKLLLLPRNLWTQPIRNQESAARHHE